MQTPFLTKLINAFIKNWNNIEKYNYLIFILNAFSNKMAKLYEKIL